MSAQENDKRLKDLEVKWLNGSITPEEAEEYAQWYNEDDESPLIIPNSVASNEEAHRLQLLNNIYARTTRKKGKIQTIVTRYAAAAAVLILMSTLALYYLNNKTKSDSVAITQVEDVLPGQDKACILTLSNGQRIEINW